MKSLSNLTNTLCKLCLNEHMYVLGVGVELERATVDIGKDTFQTLDESEAVLLCDYAAVAQHLSMGYAALNILTVHSPVKGYGRVESVYACIDLL